MTGRSDGRRLILVRHGQSTYNAENRFTGRSDPPLTERGEAEARLLGSALAAAGYPIDIIFTSALERTRRSARLILDDFPSRDRDFVSDAALDERDYGDMTGLDKDQARARWGEAHIATWRRSYAVGPPNGESLRDTAARVLPFYITRILPEAMARRSVLVVSHGNTLRALVMALEGMSPTAVEDYEIATGQATIYELSAETRVGAQLQIAASKHPSRAP